MGCNLIPIKMLRADGGGSYADGMKAIEYCVNLGAKISNVTEVEDPAAFDELMDWVGSKIIFLSQQVIQRVIMIQTLIIQ